jgi:hypothetical protein
MDRVGLADIEREIDAEARERFPGDGVRQVVLLQYGDDPEIEPGQLLARVLIAVSGDEEERRQTFDAFHDTHREALHELRRDLDGLPTRTVLEFMPSGEPADGKRRVMRLGGRPGPGIDGPGLTPVMARVGTEDLETLDTLIAAGIANSRAEAVRWALARIRERPAYEQLRARTREIADLKSQF